LRRFSESALRTLQAGASLILNLYPYASHWVGLHQKNQRLVCLNGVGRDIWQAHRSGYSEEDIVGQFSHAAAGQSASVIEGDVRQLLASMAALDKEEEEGEHFSRPAARDWPRSAAIRVPETTSRTRTTVCRLGGATVAIRSTPRVASQVIDPLIGHLETVSQTHVHQLLDIEEDAGGFRLWWQGGSAEALSIDNLVERLLFELLEAAYRVPRTLAVLHAAAVEKDGHALLFAGAQGSGKSTLTASLCAGGMPYLGDDLCPLDETGRLLPVPAPRVIKEGSWPVLAHEYPELSTLPVFQRLGRSVRYLQPAGQDQASWKKTWPVSALVFPHYDVCATQRIEILKPLEKLNFLTLSNSLRGDADLPELLRWLEAVPAYRLHYATTDQAANFLEQALSQAQL
jgi:hypothetical protein